MADTPRRVIRRDSIWSLDDDDGDQQQGLDGVAGVLLSQSFASGSLTELSSLYSMSEDVSDAASLSLGLSVCLSVSLSLSLSLSLCLSLSVSFCLSVHVYISVLTAFFQSNLD